MSAVPAVRLAPFPDEHIDSAIRRLAVFLGYPETYRFGLGRLGPSDYLDRRAELLGIHWQELDANTLRANIRSSGWGHGHDLFGMYLHAPICRRCGLASFWTQIVVVTCCPFCGQTLADNPAEHDRIQAAEFQAALIAHYKTGGPIPTRLQRLLSLIAIALPGLDDKRHLSVDVRAQRQSADEVVRFLGWAWPATTSDSALDDAVAQGVRTVLGVGPNASGSVYQSSGSARLDHELIRSGVRPIHLPTCLPPLSPDDIGSMSAAQLDIRQGAATAIASWLEIDRQRPRDCLVDLAAGWKTETVARWASWFLTRPAGLDALTDLVADLAHEPLVDLNGVRRTLRTLREIPLTVAQHLTFDADPQQLKTAASWVWLDQTRGSLRDRVGGMKTGRSMIDFAARLVPDDRLALREFGERYLRLNADLVHTASKPTVRDASARTAS